MGYVCEQFYLRARADNKQTRGQIGFYLDTICKALIKKFQLRSYFLAPFLPVCFSQAYLEGSVSALAISEQGSICQLLLVCRQFSDCIK